MKRPATSAIGHLLVTTMALGCGGDRASDDGPDIRRIFCLTAVDGDLEILNSPLEGEGLPDDEVDELITHALLQREVSGDVYLNGELWKPNSRE